MRRIFGWVVAAGLALAPATTRAQFNLSVGNPLTGGMTGISVGNYGLGAYPGAIGYSGYGPGFGGYGMGYGGMGYGGMGYGGLGYGTTSVYDYSSYSMAPGTSYFSSGYSGFGPMANPNYNAGYYGSSYVAPYGATSYYASPGYGYGYNVRRGLIGRRLRRW